MIHSGLSRLQITMLVLPGIVMQDNQEALMITYWRKHPEIPYVVRRPKLQAKKACIIVLFL
jgi:hypothetical protein